MAKCRVCDEKETIRDRSDCEDCWYFYHRASIKFKEARNIEIKFDDELALAKHIHYLYNESNYCTYTGLQLMLGDRAKEDKLKELRKKENLNEEEEKELEDLEQYKRTLNVLSLSIDRKVSKLGKEKYPYDDSDNTVLCIRGINVMKAEFEPDEFLQACFQILAYQVDKGTEYAGEVLGMIRNFNAQYSGRIISPKAEQLLKENGVYEDDFEPLKEGYKKQINKKHNRKN